jgi:hypothetical protein
MRKVTLSDVSPSYVGEKVLVELVDELLDIEGAAEVLAHNLLLSPVCISDVDPGERIDQLVFVSRNLLLELEIRLEMENQENLE